MAFNEERLGDIVFLCQVDAGLTFLADRRERRNFGLLVVPTAKQLGQFRFHFGGGEIAPHRHQHVVREEVTPVESDDVAARDVVERGIFDLPAIGRILAIDDAGEFPRRHAVRIVVPPGDAAAHFRHGQIDFLLAEFRQEKIDLAMPLRISDMARSIFSWRNSGSVSTSLKMPSTSPVFSFSAEKETEPLDSPISLSTEAAMFSSSSSIWSPVLFGVPPDRIIVPAIEARPTLSAGSSRLPVRTRTVPATIGSS